MCFSSHISLFQISVQIQQSLNDVHDGERKQYRHQMFFLWRGRQRLTQRNCGTGHQNRKGMTDRQASNFSGATFVFLLSGISQDSWSFIAPSWPFLSLWYPPAFLASLGQSEGSVLGSVSSPCDSCPYCRAHGTAGPSGSAGQGFNSMCQMLSGLINLLLPLIE